VRTLQAHWPQTRITWIIGRLEHGLVRDIEDIEFLVFDKSRGLRAYGDLRRALRGRRFDALLHMQMSLRSSAVNRLVRTPLRIGFDRARAKDLQWLFNNASVPEHQRQHVMESLFGFAEALGVDERILSWEIPIPETDAQAVAALLPPGPILLLSPCSSMAYRNWLAERYAAVADYATERHGLSVVLSGGPSSLERSMGEEIAAHARLPVTNLIGRTSLKQLLALIRRARLVISPDSGPAHMASAVGTPVIGLYACTNPDRARPYLSADLVVDRYHEAVREKHGRPAEELPWGLRVRDAGTMARISVRDVTERLDQFMDRTTRTGVN
jgi:heptosyltransferase I